MKIIEFFVIFYLQGIYGQSELPIINEFKYSTGEIELYNPWPQATSDSEVYIDAFDQNLNNLGYKHINSIAPLSYSVITYSFPSTAHEIFLFISKGKKKKEKKTKNILPI